MSARTGVRVGCFTGAAAVIAWSLLVPGAPAAAPGPVPAGVLFASVAAATGVLQHTDATMGLSATSEPVYGSLPDVYSTFSNGTGRARASTYYPGATVLGLGGLIATAGGPSGVIPTYPFTAISDDQHPDNSISSPAPIGGSGQPASAESSTAVAHVSSDLVTADGVVSSFNAPGGGPTNGRAASDTLVHIGSIQAHSRHAFDASGRLIAHADSLVSDIEIAGSLHIGSVATTSTVTVGPGARPVRDDRVMVTGATFMGTPVTIGADGVTVVAGPGQGKAALDAANAALGQSLRAAGITVHVIGVNRPPAAINPTCTSGEADGLDVHAQVDASGVPVAGNIYYTDIVLGAACTMATATLTGTGPPDAVPSVGSSGDASGVPVIVPATPAGPSSAPAGPAGAPLPAQASDQSSPAAPAARPPAGSRRPGRTSAAGPVGVELTNATVAQRFRALYLALGLIALGLVAGAKSLVPSRLPGAR